jgi:hypothetical protein
LLDLQLGNLRFQFTGDILKPTDAMPVVFDRCRVYRSTFIHTVEKLDDVDQ